MPSCSHGMASSPVHRTAPSWSRVSWGVDSSSDLSHVLDHENCVFSSMAFDRGGQEEDASQQPGVDVSGAAVVLSGGGEGKPLPGCASCRQHWCV